MDQDIDYVVRECTNCQKVAKLPIKTELTPWPEATYPMERIHCDFAGPVNGTMYLIVVDAFSRYPEVVKMKNTTSRTTMDALAEFFARFGNPKTIVSDNGSQFKSRQFEDFCKEEGIKHLCSPPFHPQSNGLAERFVDTFKRGLQKQAEGCDSSALNVFLKTYRATPCASNIKEYSPAELFIGRKFISPLGKLSLKDHNGRNKNSLKGRKMVEQFNRKNGARNKQFCPQDLVYARDYRNVGHPGWTPGTIIKRLGRSIYEVEIVPGLRWKRHANQLRSRIDKDSASVLCDEFELPVIQNYATQNDKTSPTSCLPSTLNRSLQSNSSDSNINDQISTTSVLRRSTRQRLSPQRLQVQPHLKSYD